MTRAGPARLEAVDRQPAQQLAAENTIEWNHLEFEVAYPSLDSELKIGEVYLRLLLDGSPKTLEIHTPGRFFNELYHRLLHEPRREIRLLCMQGMAVTYQSYHGAIGPFPDTTHVIYLMNRTLDKLERDRRKEEKRLRKLQELDAAEFKQQLVWDLRVRAAAGESVRG